MVPFFLFNTFTSLVLDIYLAYLFLFACFSNTKYGFNVEKIVSYKSNCSYLGRY